MNSLLKKVNIIDILVIAIIISSIIVAYKIIYPKTITTSISPSESSDTILSINQLYLQTIIDNRLYYAIELNDTMQKEGLTIAKIVSKEWIYLYDNNLTQDFKKYPEVNITITADKIEDKYFFNGNRIRKGAYIFFENNNIQFYGMIIDIKNE